MNSARQSLDWHQLVQAMLTAAKLGNQNARKRRSRQSSTTSPGYTPRLPNLSISYSCCQEYFERD